MKQVFPIIPASSGTLWVVGVIVVPLVLLFLLFLYIAFSSRMVRFEVSPNGLRISGDLYGRRIPAAALRVNDAKPLNLALQDDYALRWRTNGIGLPGYKAGWFKLKNGEKALAFVTDKTRVAYVPTTEGYSVLMSVENPEIFLDALRRVKP